MPVIPQVVAYKYALDVHRGGLSQSLSSLETLRSLMARASTRLPPLLLLLAATCAAVANAQLSENYYGSSCPAALLTIRTTVATAVLLDRRMGASLLRLYFHDCFVQASPKDLPLLFRWSSTSFNIVNLFDGGSMCGYARGATRPCCSTIRPASPAKRGRGRTQGRCAVSR